MAWLRETYDKLNAHPKWGALVQFIKFGIVGVGNTAVDKAVYYLVLWMNADLYLVGHAAGFVISVLNAFFWNSRFVFRTSGEPPREALKRLGKTYLTYGSTFLLTLLLLYLEVDRWGMSKLIAPLVNILVTIPLNFLANKFWAFRKRDAKDDKKAPDNQ